MFNLNTHAELFAKAEGSGIFFAKKGSMVADQGTFKYSKRLLGTNQGSFVGQVMNHLARRFSGENLEMMEVQGSGTVYLADQGAHVTVVSLEASGWFQSLCVESEDLLAFTDTCQYGVTPIGVGVLSQRGIFTSKLSYNGANAQVAIKTNGNPLILQAPCRVDPDAVVAWTGKAPNVKVDVNWKTFIGQTSGESYMFEFNEPGQIVIVQPFERQSGLRVGVDDNRYQPDMQESAFGNTFGNGGGGIFGGLIH
ncbi:AIM24 family protein (plasmid) [Aneurinibacillus sp. Ricciae_BoGa-3]|uniref:AIM24 family protein n=1 Tax=Aneurinibacillus sp. Ricciae_BoGa-3 TaxID=3022697 RepID=UPI0023425B5B|nr:AIM24 family protein [Aneurinibacillus sp. Ricciae_BoGa-3]WCK57771.1 AIM24 family protein [Aneurinibacillus sp. Ricciae_BoGa-3]